MNQQNIIFISIQIIFHWNFTLKVYFVSQTKKIIMHINLAVPFYLRPCQFYILLESNHLLSL